MLRSVAGRVRLAPRPSTRLRPRVTATVESLERRTLLSSGDLDPTFGAGGIVTTDIPGSSGNRTVRQTATQSDGKILQVAWHGGFGATEITLGVVRYHPDGTVDTSFGSNGLRVIDYPDRGEIFPSLAVGPGDEIVVSTWATSPTTDVLAADSDALVVVLNADGTFRTTFGNNGFALFDFGHAAGGPSAAKTTDLVFDVAVQPDGKIVTAGSITIANQGRFALARLNPNGSLDPTFDGDGVVTAPFGSYISAANALDIDPSGRIVVVGTAGQLTGTPPRVQDQDWAVARYNLSGALDTSFDGDGWTVTPFGTGTDTPFDIRVAPGGKIVASGSTINTTTATDMAVARYNANGSLDSTFSGDGKVTFSNTVLNTSGQPTQASEEAEGLAIQDDGAVLVSGRSGIGLSQTNGQVLLVRFTPSGNPDPGFGTNGKAIVPQLNEASAIVLSPPGERIVVGGHYVSNTSGFEDFGLAAFDTAGNVDFSFGPNGTGVTIADFPANGFNTVTDGVLQPDGKLVVGGLTIVNNANLRDIALARYNIDGSLDDSFGVGGIVQIDLAPSAGSDIGERIAALALDADGRIVFTGLVNDPGTSTTDIIVGRLLSDGSIDYSFAFGAGITQIAFFAGNANGNEQARDVLVQPDGRIVVVGEYASTTSVREFLALRLDPDGNFDPTFGPGGIVHLQFTGFTDTGANAVTLAPDQDGTGFDLVLAGRARTDQFALLRLNENGTPDPLFGTNGRVTSFMTGASTAAANDVLVDSLGRILAGGTARRDGDDFALMRFTPAGVPDTTFDGDGRVLTDFDAAGSDMLNSLALLGDGSILAGGTTSGNFGLAKYSAAGALDATFGTAGRAVVDFEPGFFPGAPATSRDSGAKVLVYPSDRAVMVGNALLPKTGSDFAAARLILSGVPNAAPVANAGGPYVMDEGGAGITLSAAGSSDADGTIIKYEWDLSYDTFAGFLPDVRGVEVAFPAQADEGSPNTRRVALRVTDDNFATHTVIFTITVNNVAPIVAPLPDVTISPGATYTAAGSFTDPGASDTFTATVNYGDGPAQALPLNPDKTYSLNHTYATPGTYTVVVTVRDNDGGQDTEEIIVNVPGVVSRQIYYFRSGFDTAAGGPLAAVPTQKQPLFPGATATAANITHYSRGINGLIVTLDGVAVGEIAADDFQFTMGIGGNPSTWADAPQPEHVEITPVASRTRIVITWADGAIRNTWLRTTLLANADTKLLSPDTFYIGNLIGDAAGPVGRIDGADYLATRAALSTPASIDSPADHDHDGRHTALDLAWARRFIGNTLALITAPPELAAARGSAGVSSVPPATGKGRPGVRPDRRSILDFTPADVLR